MAEYSFSYRGDNIPAGRVVFRVHNAGNVDHELGLWPLDEDFPPIDEQLHGSERRVLTPFARTEILAPGRNGGFAVDLVPNRRYALICFLRGPDGLKHELQGMNAEFRSGSL